MRDNDRTAVGSVGTPAVYRRWPGPALILLTAAMACVPVVRHLPYCGDDVQFHMLSWFDAQQSWRAGVAYPQWSMSANFGAGEPRFVFYPPLTWMLGGALGLWVPWTWVPVAMMFLLLAGTGFATRALARRLLPETATTMAGVAAVMSVYALFTAYDRAGFGELAGGVWVLLVLLFAIEGAMLPLALTVAGCWLSDAPAGVMAMYLLVAVAVATAAMERAWIPVVRAAMGGVLGLGLAAFYWLPAAYEQRWVNIHEAAGDGDPGLRVENNVLFGHSTNPPMPGHDAGLHFVSLLVVWMVTVSLVSAVVLWRRGFGRDATVRQRRMWRVLAGIPVAVMLLQLRVSLPLWETLPELRYLQFPWRWLLVVEAPMAALLAGVLWPSDVERRWKRFAMVAAFCGVVMGSLVYVAATGFKNLCNAQELPPRMTDELRAGLGSWGADEYATVGSENLMVPSGLPDVCVVDRPEIVLGSGAGPDLNPAWASTQGSCIATGKSTERTPAMLRIGFASPQAGWAVLKLRRYPAWRVRVNGVEMRTWPWRADGLIVVPVAKGRVEIVADWHTTWDVTLGRWLSAGCALMVAAVWGIGRRSKARGAEA